ncbi:hypothetical protein BJ166DRAFT_501964 [Pestalotiopsis sp. NC0098]|nr:hypothetical protein BJ166DRAFT_501964 [Pestalotiopsis sp. NC0098]
MDQQTDLTWVAPILRLPTEIYFQIIDDIGELAHVATFVSCCRTISTLLGRDFVHIRSANEWRDGKYDLPWTKSVKYTSRIGQHEINVDVSPLPTLHLVISTTQDKDILAWVADIYKEHYHESITTYFHWRQRRYEDNSLEVFKNIHPLPLEFAIRCDNTAAMQILLDRIDKSKYFGFNVESSKYRLGHDGTWGETDDILDRVICWGDREQVPRILVRAGHYVFPDHIKQAVRLRNATSLDALFEGIQRQKPTWPVSPYLDEAPIWGDNVLEDYGGGEEYEVYEDLDEREQDRNTARSVFDKLIKGGVRIDERRYNLHGFTEDSYPVQTMLNWGWTERALYFLKHQVLQNLNSPHQMRKFVEASCEGYGVVSEYWDQWDRHYWNYYYPTTVFIKGFHPDFTTHLVDGDDTPEQREGDQLPVHQDSERFRKGCEFLLTNVLENIGPLQRLEWPLYEILKEGFTYLLENGCSVSTNMIMRQIGHWRRVRHFLLPGHRNPDTRKDSRPTRGNPACSVCEAEDWDTPALHFEAEDCYTRTIVGHIDKLLSLAGPDSINGVGRCPRLSDNDDDPEVEIQMTPLSWALISGLWMVAYRLIHHGAGLSDLHTLAKESIGGLYNETFPQRTVHPLVEKARQGRYKPDRRVFAGGVDGDHKVQALTLVMLTIGLPGAASQPVDLGKDNVSRKRRGNQGGSAKKMETRKTNGSRHARAELV